ncbi:NAD(P)-dependent oxidoreductase [Hoeflea sp.]|uniref:NAD(P)-dependent oxidoreductase n=1 Tax=Hoeflea sp. TaxID=1940281 RepID=UPI0019CA688B|nr:NAD(P)-dependent oxidoreductase [Hoeflea sp.]MBC7282164.1 NAD(P)-dependent oxidoreductase [Hoeflea sp.]
MNHLPERLATIGFGEAAEAFSSGWRETYHGAIACFDVKVRQPGGRARLEARAGNSGVTTAETAADAVAGAPVIFSLVTADQALIAAQECAPHLGAEALWFDCNSCSPGTKRQAAHVIEAAGGVYVDVAVMAPVHPKRHQTPLLVSGPQTGAAMDVLEALGMNPVLAGDEVGQASSIKMFRSVMIKGLEALTGECLLAARRAGVERDVLASLQASDPGFDWTARSAYSLERMMVHGERRAAEMREVSRTIAELGLPSRMSDAITEWQAQIAGLHLDGGKADLGERADRILSALSAGTTMP